MTGMASFQVVLTRHPNPDLTPGTTPSRVSRTASPMTAIHTLLQPVITVINPLTTATRGLDNLAEAPMVNLPKEDSPVASPELVNPAGVDTAKVLASYLAGVVSVKASEDLVADSVVVLDPAL